ncbi:dihydroorotase [Bosea sp. PAMC 26642]|uniref:dihydroorotase n=1 Tax=Bosea sp. (strain PAMC 26642) TaxID=1792307 RepID=UPI00076FFA0A|nr:amidohydrolase family protein [Bosea sp. PAMC 26642]AMJ61465.1 allantoinase [Bosea sp. PAMC 26642]
MSDFDVLIENARIVTETASFTGFIGIRDGRTAALGHGAAAGSATERIDAGGLVALPGAIDVHVHFTGSQDDSAEELRNGSLGAAAGGVTTFLEMPHSAPPATTLAAFLAKRDLIARNSVVDFGLWAGLDGTNDGEFVALREAGALGFKAFLCSGSASGEAPDHRGLPMLDDDGLARAMRLLGPLRAVIGIHAENQAMLHGAIARLKAAGRHDVRAHAQAGPELAEVEAVARVIALARELNAPCHIVHLSSARAAALIAQARGSVDVTAETCPHYLILDEEDLVRIGADARCGPPLRPRANVDALNRFVVEGALDILASDHCPYLPEQKRAGDASIWEAGMGLTGIETLVPMSFSHLVAERGMSLVDFARLIATAPARRFGLYPRKGAIAPGFDADVCLFDPAERWTVHGRDLHGQAKWTAFEGMACTGRPVRTLVRGQTVWNRGRVAAFPGYGRYQAPV